MQPKRNLLSVALASATLLLAAQAQAQDAAAPQAEPSTQDAAAAPQDAQELDTVVVTGIRRGIQDSIDTKQAEDTIVEAVSAEDIGKLPDASIADSIARLPGLTAQRFAGKPQEINIRGFAGDFSTTLLNGREQVSMGNNRGVEFDQYPSELMSQVVVHKTTDGTLVGQGLSGTVDLKTIRPLSFEDRTIALNYRADMNKIGDEKAYGNRYSFSYVDQFADRTIGLALGYAHMDNPGQGHQFNAWGYEPYEGANGAFSQIGGADIYALQNDNTRDGAFATLEWKPNDVFSSTLDVFYSKFDRKEYKQGIQFDLGGGVADNISGNGTALSGVAPVAIALIRNDYNAFEDELYSLGWKNEIAMGERWKLTTDISHSSGKRSQPILETYAVRRPGLTDAVAYAYNSDGYYDLDFGLDYTDPSNFVIADPGCPTAGSGGCWGGDVAQAGYLKTFSIRDTLTATRVDLERSFDEGFISSLKFGANYTDRKKTAGSDEFSLCLAADCSNPGGAAIPDALVANRGFGFVGVDSLVTIDPWDLADGVLYQQRKQFESISAKNWEVREQIGTFYVQANIDANLGSVPLRGNVGVQAVNSDQSSSGYQTYEGGGPVGNLITGGSSYVEYLPSTNLSLEFPASQFLRFGASRQMARPRMDQMAINNSITINRSGNPSQNPNGTDAPFWDQSGGNPQLEPWLANAYDLSYEKYFGGNKGYVSVAYFYKDLKTYIYNQTTTFDIRDTSVPYQNYTEVTDFTGRVTQPRNGNGGTIEGLELAVSIPFDLFWAPLEGFGFIGSYSDTKSSIQPLGPDSPDEPLPGLSKYVSNLTLYYERYGFSVRASQRSRSAFVGEVQGDGAVGGTRQKQFFDGEKVVDAQIGYTFQSGPLENLSLLFQVNNLTDEPFRRYADFTDRPLQFNEYGRTYLLGLNYKF